MRRWEQWAAHVGRAYTDAAASVRDGARTVATALADERTQHERLMDEFGLGSPDDQLRADAVCAALNAVRSRPPLEVQVLRSRQLLACTLPGRWVYASSGLLERMPRDGALAFVLGHEMAHHDLGHLTVDGVGGGYHDLALFAKRLALLWAQPEWELAADAEGARLAVAAGYPLDACVAALRALEQWALDHEDRAAVFGVETHEGSFAEWLRQRSTGYLALRDRVRALQRFRPT